MTDQDRKEFEAWAISEGYQTSKFLNGGYRDARTHMVYAAWQAARAQPAQSAYLRVIDEELVCAHIGVANISDTEAQAKAKLAKLIAFHVDVATDPTVNGGYELVKAQPAQEPVAVVGPVYALDWVGTGPVAPLFKKHGIKVGDFLYTHPQPKQESLSDEQVAKAIAVWFDDEFTDKGMLARMRAAIEATKEQA